MGIILNRESAAAGLDHALERDGEFATAFGAKIFAAAQPGAVFGAPVISGAYTVITASEVGAGGGFGSGRGTGTRPAGQVADTGAAAQGEGGGVGGGGGAMARPVAVIAIGPEGVTVKPIFDVTKIALTGITAWATMLATLLRIRAKAR